MEVHLGVAPRAEDVAVALELAPELGKVVDLAVLDDDARAVLADDRLVAALEVDDREPPRRERDGAVDVFATAVGAPMHERAAHCGQAVGIGRADRGGNPADPAHGGLLYGQPPRASSAARRNAAAAGF